VKSSLQEMSAEALVLMRADILYTTYRDWDNDFNEKPVRNGYDRTRDYKNLPDDTSIRPGNLKRRQQAGDNRWKCRIRTKWDGKSNKQAIPYPREIR